MSLINGIIVHTPYSLLSHLDHIIIDIEQLFNT